MSFKQGLGRILSKGSILIPIGFAFTLYYDSKVLYIKELNYMRNPHWTYIMFIAFNLIWQALPGRKYFSGWYEILYNLFPIEAFLVLYFAQRHFGIAVFLVLLAGLLMLSAVRNNQKEREKCRTRRKYWRIKRENYRAAFLGAFLLGAVPAFLAYYIYEMEGTTYIPSSEAVMPASSDNSGISEDSDDLFAQYNGVLCAFRDKDWEQKDSQEKTDLAQEFINFEAERLGIPSVPVSSKKLNNLTVIAYYDSESKEIVADDLYLQERTGTEFMKTLCEETYHAMEDYVVTNMDWEISVINTQYFQELRDWKDNTENYTYIGSFEEYENQPIEASAKKYAAEEVARILEYLDNNNGRGDLN